MYFTTYFQPPAIMKRWVQCHTIRSKCRIKITTEMDDFGSLSPPVASSAIMSAQKSTPKPRSKLQNPQIVHAFNPKFVLCNIHPLRLLRALQCHLANVLGEGEVPGVLKLLDLVDNPW